MKENMIMVESNTDWTVVMDIPELSLKRIWTRKGQKYPIERDVLEHAYYNPAIETLFKDGSLYVDDKQFLSDVGLIDAEIEENPILKIDDNFLNRMIKLVPMVEFKDNLKKMTHNQIEELAEYAVAHYTDLKMDRIDILTKASGRNIMKSVENFKAAQED